jgi:predicted molibdopterin-dependent oxidoreductase YjgC
MRIQNHPILGEQAIGEKVTVIIEGKQYAAIRGEMIAATLMANGIVLHRYTAVKHEPRGIFCGIGQCTDCVMTVNGVPNVRTCITPVEDGMVIETQHGYGSATHD